ncbi:MAG TPA: hypothetical protein VNP72_01295 [Longimicrobium sp.]|nr:hypothetical protein [Longimicrobium sp.]
MRDKLKERVDALKAEFEQGEKMMAELQRKQAELRDTLLRISGAIQVLEEALGQEPEGGDVGDVGDADGAPVLDLPARPETLAAD